MSIAHLSFAFSIIIHNFIIRIITMKIMRKEIILGRVQHKVLIQIHIALLLKDQMTLVRRIFKLTFQFYARIN